MADAANDKSVRFLYGTAAGRVILHLILALRVPRLLGAVLRSTLSRLYIPSFVRKNKIDMTDFEGVRFKSFNDFFTRKKEISFDSDGAHLISPADSLLSVFPITQNARFRIKGFDYTLGDFFDAERFGLSAEETCGPFIGGTCLVFRLCATDYHRYCYVDSGSHCFGNLGGNHFIEGSLYSVQPLAAEKFRIYTKNRRSWTILETENFGRIAQIEVGAFSVGGIQNHHGSANGGSVSFRKGDEKGYFDLHGSTIVLLVQKDRVRIRDEIKKASDSGVEFRVRIGECVGVRS